MLIRFKKNYLSYCQTKNSNMKKKLFFAAMATVLLAYGSFAQRTCQTMDVLAEQQKEDPLLQERMQQIEEFTQNALLNQMDVNGVITIPVVVHVLYQNATENISDAQIASQIAVLNADFKRLNADANNTPSIFAALAADIEIQFCLASVDPNGNATSGITRKSTKKSTWQLNDDMKKSNRGGTAAWPCGSYMNMWVCDLTSGYLGYAQFPGGACATDGVVIDYAYFGTIGTATAPFNLGRTATHEVGHRLNLRHIWGDGGCSVDDFVSDTPPAGGANYTGSPCTFPGPNTCNTGAGDLPDMFQNYMDYSDDACMNLFTSGQKGRMRTLFDAGGARASLLNSVGCGGTPPAPTCSDGIQNGNETGIDCGGSCPSCPPTICNATTNISVAPRKQGREATITWAAVSGATSYEVSLKLTSSSTWGAPFITSAVSIVATGLTKNVSYDVRVATNCGSSQSAYTVKTFIAGQSARQGDEGAGMSFYPNPANNVLNVELFSEFNEASEVLIIDMSGKVVVRKSMELTEGVNTFEIDLGDCANGMYMLTITSENMRETTRISILK
jgi:hypothetical protein